MATTAASRAMLHNATQSHLPNLPAEIRLKIYRLTEPEAEEFKSPSNHKTSRCNKYLNPRSGLYLTCSLLHNELSGEPAPKVHLQLSTGDRINWALSIVEKMDASRVTQIRTDLTMPGSMWPELRDFNPAKIAAAFPNLELLTFEFVRSRRHGPYYLDSNDHNIWSNTLWDWGKSFVAAHGGGMVATEPTEYSYSPTTCMWIMK